MSEFLLDYGLFLLKLITVVSLLGALLIVFLGVGSGTLGEHWYGSRALAMNLADELKTSDDYLLESSREAAIFHLHWEPRRTLTQKLLDEPLSRLRSATGWP